MSTVSHKYIERWLFLVMGLVIAMIVFGGATRLTNSGLSITEWRPITGALPPLSIEHWNSEFEKYKQIPEFSAEHPDMDLDGFKFIYLMEWGHRQLGRIIGLAYALPFFWWAFRKKLPAGKFGRFFSILLLIGVQGAVGWWMVASGLVHDRVDVAPYRLATHLGLAFIVVGLLYWTWRDQRAGWTAGVKQRPVFRHALLLQILIFLQIVLGAFVAGNHAGKTYNTWPMMDGRFVPDGYAMLSPFWRNLTENIAAIQFNHRFLAYVILAATLALLFRSFNIGQLKRKVSILTGVILFQVVLGIWTLLAIAPLNLSLAHQFTGIVVFLVGLAVVYDSRNGDRTHFLS